MNMEKTETLSYKLDVFEGPLDLLLNLIAKNKLNIYDIPIAELLVHGADSRDAGGRYGRCERIS